MSFSSVFKSVVEKVTVAKYNPLNVLSAIVTNPVTTITKGLSAGEKAFQEATPVQNTIKTLYNTGNVALAVVGGAEIGTSVKAGSFVAPVIKTIATKLALPFIGAELAIPIVAQSSKLSTKVVELPENIASAQKDVGELIDEPSLEKGISFIKNHPGVSATVLAAGLAALGYTGGTIASLISNYSNTEAVKKNTAATLGIPPTTDIPTSIPTSAGQGITIINQLPPQYLPPTYTPVDQVEKVSMSNANLVSRTPTAAVVAPPQVAPAAPTAKKKVKKKAKKKKKTRRSKKKTNKKSIKRKKTKK